MGIKKSWVEGATERQKTVLKGKGECGDDVEHADESREESNEWEILD